MRHDWEREEKRIEALAGCGGILNYWTAFWVNWAVGCLFGGSFSNIALRDKK